MQEEAPKKHYARTILITLIAVVIVVIVGTIIYIWQTTGAPPIEIVNSFLGNPSNSNNPTNNNLPSNNSNMGSSPTGSSGSSGGGGGGSSSGSSSICYNIKVSYSIEKIVKEVTCLQESGSDCLEQKINCTAQIHNFDDEITGDFDVKIDFIDRTQGGDPISSKTDSFTIEPLNFSIIQEVYSIQGQNPDLDCAFSTLSAPSKEVCY